MKKIIKFKTNQKEILIDEMCSSYLFSYLFLFIMKNGLNSDDSLNIFVCNEFVLDLEGVVSSALRDLLQCYYDEPSLKEQQKYPTRFQRILLDGKKYKVNYRMSENGRLAYTINCIINFIDDARLKDIEIMIECE